MSNANTLDFRPSGSIDFEPVSIPAATAPAAPVDDKIDHDPLSINFGREKLHKPAAAERMLASGATVVIWDVDAAAADKAKAWEDLCRARALMRSLKTE